MTTTLINVLDLVFSEAGRSFISSSHPTSVLLRSNLKRQQSLLHRLFEFYIYKLRRLQLSGSQWRNQKPSHYLIS